MRRPFKAGRPVNRRLRVERLEEKVLLALDTTLHYGGNVATL